MLDLKAQHRSVSGRVAGLVEQVIEDQRFILGPMVERFENAAASFLGARHAVGVSSGSDALVVALLALGVAPGSEVITTPFSFFATVEAILRVGAVPRLVDIGPTHFDLDPAAVEAAFSDTTAAVVVAHLYGHPARIDALVEVAARRGVPVVEDAAQAFGARLHGRCAGTFGALGCFSFQPTKPLGAWGDAGLVVTNDAELAARCRSIRSHGAVAKHEHAYVGGNYRLDAIQAAVLLAKLDALEDWLEARRRHILAYNDALAGVSGLGLPIWAPGARPSGALYTVRVAEDRRDALAAFLASRGIETAVHYPTPFHHQRALAGRVLFDALPEAERAAREVLSLPLYPELTGEMRQAVVDAVLEFFGGPRRETPASPPEPTRSGTLKLEITP